MEKYIIKFENVDFSLATGVYGSTLAGELGQFDAAINSDADFEKCTISYDNSTFEEYCEIFSSLIIGMIEAECAHFVLKGTYGTDTHLFAQYKDDVLSVSKTTDAGKDEAEYCLENGLFDDEDSDEFSCFFD